MKKVVCINMHSLIASFSFACFLLDFFFLKGEEFLSFLDSVNPFLFHFHCSKGKKVVAFNLVNHPK